MRIIKSLRLVGKVAGEVVVLGVRSVSGVGVEQGERDEFKEALLTSTIANTMANGQPFFVQLAKQVATTEGGG